MTADIETLARPAKGAPPALDLADERAIAALIIEAAAAADERRYLDWMNLFSDEGVYAAITHENFADKGLRLFTDAGRAALHERVAFLMGLLQVPRGKTLHLVANLVVKTGDTPDAAAAVSNFLVTRTAEGEHTQLHAAGRYLDQFVRQDGSWKFAERLVIVDSSLLPPEFTELL